MKIMLVSENMMSGGASFQWLNRMRRMSHHDFYVLVTSQLHDNTLKYIENIPNVSGYEVWNEKPRDYHMATAFDLISRIQKKIADYKPDIVIARSWNSAYFTSYAAQKTSTPLIVYHGGEVQHDFANANEENKKFVSHAHAYAYAIVSNSQRALDTFSRFPNIDKSVFRVIEQGGPTPPDYNLLKETRRIFREQMGFSDEDFVIGCYAHIRSSKRQIEIIHFARSIEKTHPNVKFIFWGETLGEGDYYNRFLAEITTSPNVEFQGEIGHLSPLLSILDLHILLSFHEGFPNAVLETLFFGIPQLLSDIHPHRIIKQKSPSMTTITQLGNEHLLKNLNEIINKRDWHRNLYLRDKYLPNFTSNEQSDQEWENLFSTVLETKITVLFPSVQVGGTELTWIRRLIRLSELGYNCQAIVLQDVEGNERGLDTLRKNNIFTQMKTRVRDVQEAIDTFNPDIIFALMSMGRDFIADLRVDKYKVVSFQGSEISKLIGRSLRGLQKSDYFIGSADYISQQFSRYGIPTCVIHTGTETPSLPNKVKLRDELGIPQDKILVGTVGNIRPVKNTYLFLEAAEIVHRKYPDVVFYVAGDDTSNYAKQLKGIIKSKNASEYFVLMGSVSQYHPLLRIWDINVNTSNTEAYCLGLRERMLDQIPAVVTKNRGNAHVVKDGQSGYVVEQNANSVARAIIKLIEDKPLRESMGKFAREDIDKRFSIGEEIKQYIDFIEDIKGK